MRRRTRLRTMTLGVLLLPGLVLAAPTPGACGHCDRGVPCVNRAAPEPVVEAHSCCDTDRVENPESTPMPVGAGACDCGREAPKAVSSVEGPVQDPDCAGTPTAKVRSESGGDVTQAAASRGASAAPPHPLIFLIDCVFLT